MIDFNKKLEEYQKGKQDRMVLAKILGFDTLGYDNQLVIFNKARMFGWEGEHPSVLGSHRANTALDDAIKYLIEQKVTFRKEGT